MHLSNQNTRLVTGYVSLVPRPPPAFFEFMKILQAIKAGDKAGDEAMGTYLLVNVVIPIDVNNHDVEEIYIPF